MVFRMKKTQGRSLLDIKITKRLCRCEGSLPRIHKSRRSSIKQNGKHKSEIRDIAKPNEA